MLLCSISYGALVAWCSAIPERRTRHTFARRRRYMPKADEAEVVAMAADGLYPPPTVDLSEFEAAAPVAKRCWFSLLEPDQQAKVVAARRAGHVQKTICTVLGDWGAHVPARTAWTNHFSGNCQCPRNDG
jgi:hypothetical protein